MTRRYITHTLQDTQDILTTLATQLVDLDRRLTAWARDGYPSSSGQPGGTRSNLSDPTSDAVLAGDTVRHDRETLHANIVRIHNLALDIDAIRRTYMTPVAEKEQIRDNSLSKCSNMHGCPDDAWADKAGRCNACYMHLRRHERDRTRRGGDED